MNARRLAVLQGLEHLIAHAVLRGHTDTAREWAVKYAQVRDDGLTAAELCAAVGRAGA